jgi:hypothetical protein
MRTIAAFLLVTSLAFSASAVPVITRVTPQTAFRFAPTLATVSGSGFGTGPLSVFVGGVPAEVLSSDDDEIRIRIFPSVDGQPRPLGRADVRVVLPAGGGEATRQNAIDFTDYAETLDNYTPLLVPILTGEFVPGANGSLWAGELTIFNASAFNSLLLGPFNDPRFITPPMGPMHFIDSGRTDELMPLFARSNSGGAFIHVPNPQLDDVKLSLRVRDLSATDRNWGTDLPVVEREDAASEVTLLDIPTDQRFRATLRVYHWSAEGGWPARVRVFVPNNPVPVATFDLSATAGAASEWDEGEELLLQPGYSQLDLLTPEIRAAGQTIRVEIDNLAAIISPPPPPIWAFVSVTNNETQQVTVMTPK